MRTPSRAFAGAAALIAAALVLTMGTASVAAPGQDQAPGGPGRFPGDQVETKDKDNRKGRAAPSARQQAKADEVGARARWNDFGTPATLTSTGDPLATGLSADPVAAAEAYVAANRDLLGLTQRGAAALEVVTVAPMGEGAAFEVGLRGGDDGAERRGVGAECVVTGTVRQVRSQ